MLKRIFLGATLLLVILTFITQADYSTEYGTSLDDDMKAYCNRDTAYSTGVSDARKGLARKEDFAEICSTDRAVINAAYNTGFNYGLTNQSGLIINEPAPYHPAIQSQLPSSTVQPYTRQVQAVDGTGQITPLSPNGSIIVGGASGVGIEEQAPHSAIYPGETEVTTGDLARPEPEHGLKSLIDIKTSRRPKCIETPNGEACGFNCVNSLNNVRCAASPDQVCRGNQSGDIACGYNCIATSKVVRCAAFPTDLCIADVNGYVFCGQNCRVDGNATAVCDIERYAP